MLIHEKTYVIPIFSSTETSSNSEISLVAIFDLIFSKNKTNNKGAECADAQAGLRPCSQTPEDRFSRVEAQLCSTPENGISYSGRSL